MKARNILIRLAILTQSLIIGTTAYSQEEMPAKVSHAEPLYADLVRDLGARKGEKEWNLGADFKNHKADKMYGFLVEYEFAPINRLGLEIETDFVFSGKSDYMSSQQKMEGLRLSSQYSFLVAPKIGTTLAVGYTHIFEMVDFRKYGKEKLIEANVYNPFFIAAKRWGSQFHSLIYTGPEFTQSIHGGKVEMEWFMHTSFHYYIPKTKHFIGMEFSKRINEDGEFHMIMRPQIKLKMNEHLALGMVGGIPVGKTSDGFSTFFRLIYEP